METLREAIEEFLGKVEDVRQRGVVALSPWMLLGDAARELEAAQVSGGPVLQEGRIVGMVSLDDLFQAAGVSPKVARTSGPWLRYERGMSQSGRRVADAMTPRTATIRPDASVAEAAAVMREQRVNRLPVVDEQGRLCGIVARDDVIAAVASAVRRVRGTPRHAGAPAIGPDC